MAIYFVDPASGDDGNDGRSADEPLRTLRAATDRLRRGDVLRLHAGSIFRPPAAFPADLAGTPEEPIVVEPYAGPTATFDARLVAPPVDVVPNLEWERVAGGHPEEWRSRQVLELPGSPTAARVRYGAFVDSRLRLITYSRIEDLRADERVVRRRAARRPPGRRRSTGRRSAPQEAVDVPRARPDLGVREPGRRQRPPRPRPCPPVADPPARPGDPRLRRPERSEPGPPRPLRRGQRRPHGRGQQRRAAQPDDRQRWHHHPDA